MVGLMTASFVVVYMPGILRMILSNKDTWFRIITAVFAYFLVVIDPLIYIYSSEKYRNEIRIILSPILLRINNLYRKSDNTSENETQEKLTNISQKLI